MIADTNILLRIVDGPGHPLHETATHLVSDALAKGEKVHVTDATVHEIAYVLRSKAAGYGFPPESVAGTIADLLDAPELTFENTDVLRLACELYGSTGIDFHDCYLATLSHLRHGEPLSLDDDIAKLRRLLPN